MITIATIEQVNYFLSIGGVIAILATLGLVYDLFTKRALVLYVGRWGIHTALAVTVSATILTLIYSELFGLIPCGLCWLERIALYPQLLLAGMALRYKDTLMMPRYGIGLSIFGLVVSVYHHYIQMGGAEFIKCPAAGAGDCAQRFFFEFGFMTFPLMSAILFAFLIVLYVYMQKCRAA
jgi:disulfide bond formation protein DsbB